MRQSSASPKTNPETPRLLNQVREKIRLKHYSIRTEQAYTDWIRRFILYHENRHPVEMSAVEVEQFLTHLGDRQGFRFNPESGEKHFIVFFYQDVPAIEFKGVGEIKISFLPSHPKR